MNPKICKYPGCKTVLTQYNDGNVCFAHKAKYTLLVDKTLEELKYRMAKTTKRQKRLLRIRIRNLELLNV